MKCSACIHTMECYFTIRRNEVLIYVTAWMELENVMLSERKLATKDWVLCDSVCMKCPE